MKYQLEVCAFTIQSCLIAQRVGAARVELCDNPLEGGTTPSYGTIRKVRESLTIQLYPIIRPRSMNYFYDNDEWEILKEDVRMCKQLQCDGISVGTQLRDGKLDSQRMREVVDLAYPMRVTCNRAFDAVPDPAEALELLIDAGCERVLTSGLASTALEGLALLKQLVKQANNRISIMPGAGVRASNLPLLLETGATEFHTSARMSVANPLTFTTSAVTDSGSMFICDELELIAMLQVLSAKREIF